MRFHVPQFLDIEDKIFGPLSFKQFIYLAGGAGIIIVIWYFAESLTITAIVGLPIGALAVALAFYKINQKPFIYIVEAFFKYILAQRMYIWKKQPKETSEESISTRERQNKYTPLTVPRMSNSKLKDLEWSVDVSGSKDAVVPTEHARNPRRNARTDSSQQNNTDDTNIPLSE